jgi:hypothetical protein
VRTEDTYGWAYANLKVQGGWSGSWSGFVDEGFNGMQGARRAPTTVRLEMLALVNHRSTVIDLPVASYDNFVLIHWDEVSV